MAVQIFVTAGKMESRGQGVKFDAQDLIEVRRKHLSFGDWLIAEEVSDLREGWMTHADAVLADEEVVANCV